MQKLNNYVESWKITCFLRFSYTLFKSKACIMKIWEIWQIIFFIYFMNYPKDDVIKGQIIVGFFNSFICTSANSLFIYLWMNAFIASPCFKKKLNPICYINSFFFSKQVFKLKRSNYYFIQKSGEEIHKHKFWLLLKLEITHIQFGQ